MKKFLKKFLKQKQFLYIISFFYNIPFFLKNIVYLKKAKIDIRGAFLKNVKLNIKNDGNVIKIGEYTRIENLKINMLGYKSKLDIRENCIIKESNFWFEDKETKIIIGNKTTFENVHIAALENFKKVEIGDDCMFSRGIEIRTGDSHAIISEKSNKKINWAKDIYIGNHVWLGANTTVLKGVQILDNSVVGMGSIVTKDVNKNTLVVGVPATAVNEKINWSRSNMVR